MSSGDTVNIVKSAAATWRQVCSVVNKAVVFLDSRLAECLHWNGGAMLLLSAGAVNVKELSSFEVRQKASSPTTDTRPALPLICSNINNNYIQYLPQ